MKKYERTTVYARDGAGRGRQFILPWGPGKTISTVEAGRRINACHDTVRKMLEEGELLGWRIRNKKRSPWLVDVDFLEKYIARTIRRHDIADPRASLPIPQSPATPRLK